MTATIHQHYCNHDHQLAWNYGDGKPRHWSAERGTYGVICTDPGCSTDDKYLDTNSDGDLICSGIGPSGPTALAFAEENWLDTQ